MLPISFIQKEIKTFVKEQLSNTGQVGEALFFDWKKTVKNQKFKSVREANTRLREMKARLMWGNFDLAKFDNESICDYCETRAKNTERMMPKFPSHLPVSEIAQRLDTAGRLSFHGMELNLPEDESKHLDILEALYKRVLDHVWWRRKLKRAQKRSVEGVARDIGLVQKYKGGYCSNISLFNQRNQNTRNEQLLDHMVAENQDGESFYLSELQELSISNPEVRRAELMTRIRGFEIMADRLGYQAAFWTMTCPSKYHAFYSTGGKNKKHKGDGVLDGQEYLCTLWAGFRSWLKRNGIDGFGFRVAEPHHDGCPHWHVLYFAPKTQLEDANTELEERCLREDGNEFGATKNRFKVEWIKRGKDQEGRTLSAAAYIAKYISKSIDGHQVGFDKETGQNTQISSERVVTWARTWGIRQFQQIGGAPVGLWRELRRLKNAEREETENLFLKEAQNEIFDLHDKIEGYEDKAEAWAVFNMLVGSGRDTLFKLWKTDIPDQIRISKYIEFDHSTGEVLGTISSNHETGVCRRNQYGEPVKVIKGLMMDMFGHVEAVRTRFYEWILKRSDIKREREYEPSQAMLL
jgi:hypothetical protein